MALPNGGSVFLDSHGNYRGTPGTEDYLVYVVQTEDGQETLTTKEFAWKYKWQNDPDKVRRPDPE